VKLQPVVRQKHILPSKYYDTFISVVAMDRKRKYFEEYLKFGFTFIVGKNTMKP